MDNIKSLKLAIREEDVSIEGTLEELVRLSQELDLGYGPNPCKVCLKSNCEIHTDKESENKT